MSKVFFHNANADVKQSCENCFYATKTDIDGLIECERENGRTKDTDMVCEHWEGE
jgi:hypothetical protein